MKKQEIKKHIELKEAVELVEKQMSDFKFLSQKKKLSIKEKEALEMAKKAIEHYRRRWCELAVECSNVLFEIKFKMKQQ